MIHIVLMVFLTILKIIGILLLCVLGLLLLTLLSVLLVPVRYRGEGVFCAGGKRISVKATWFLHLVSMAVQFDGEWKITGKLLGVQMYPKKRKTQKTPGKLKKRKKRVEEERDEPEGAKEPKTTKALDEISESEDGGMLSDSKSEEKVPADEVQKVQEAAEPSPIAKEAGFWEKHTKKVCGLFNRISMQISDLRKALANLRDSVRKIKDKIVSVWNFLEEKCTKESISFIKKRLFLILKHIRPRKITGFVHFGTGDPAFTGQLLGGISMIYGFFPDTLEIIPDFEKQVLEGNVRLRGHIRAIHFVMAAASLFFNKNVRETIEKAKSL